MKLKIGNGYDVHKLAEGRKLVLCGIEIKHEKGLDGHSDADVAIHALIDAICGASGLGDIGRLFPDTDDRYKGISSILLLKETLARCKAKGYEFQNGDITIIAQAPKLSPHIGAMQKKLAEAIGCDEDDISVKATTTEHLGFTGRKEGIAAIATAMVGK